VFISILYCHKRERESERERIDKRARTEFLILLLLLVCPCCSRCYTFLRTAQFYCCFPGRTVRKAICQSCSIFLTRARVQDNNRTLANTIITSREQYWQDCYCCRKANETASVTQETICSQQQQHSAPTVNTRSGNHTYTKHNYSPRRDHQNRRFRIRFVAFVERRCTSERATIH
jgi:hypothetical protein